MPYDSRFGLWQGISTAVYRLYAQSLASFDRVIIFSEQQKSLLEHYGVPADNIAVIPNGVDVEKYSPGASDYKKTLDAGANCTNQKYLVADTLHDVATPSTSGGTGTFRVTLTHYRHRVLGRCIAYKARVSGTVTLAY